MLDDVRKFLFLLFALVHFLFQVSDLPADGVETMAVCGSVCDRADEGRIGIFEGLTLDKQKDSWIKQFDEPYPPSYQQVVRVSES